MAVSFAYPLLLTLILSQSLHSWPPAEAIRPSYFPAPYLSKFRQAPFFINDGKCPVSGQKSPGIWNPSLIHIALTLDTAYLRGSIAAVHSALFHAGCPENLFFHFLVAETSPPEISPSFVKALFPTLNFKFYPFSPKIVKDLISSSVRQALEQPLNYARNYIADLLPNCVRRVIYLDSDLVLVDDVDKLWRAPLAGKAIGAPEYCHVNFTKYFTPSFWSEKRFSGVFRDRNACYFNTGVMVIDLDKWRRDGYTWQIERWMRVQKEKRIYELGSLPPFLLVFAGKIEGIEHRWNQHGLGGDRVTGSCRDLHPGPVSLLHWSGSGKPWQRLDAGNPCPLDRLWAPYDLYGPSRPYSLR
ncbi:hypothetical protein AMTRI_Chr13g84940 [Amborella trichopoda]|uniref:Hexosyltransferase n=2 Tax=Amborella trichopoda TaxID=13333 RepID=W1P3B3_AMBTC|nr:hypothetical protein AMTR_s00147p00025700 [Amborella trichopoda]